MYYKDRLLWLPKSCKGDILTALKARCTVRSPYAEVPTIYNYEEYDDIIGFPRALRLRGYKIQDKTIHPQIVGKTIKFHGELREHQSVVVEKWTNARDNGIYDTILNLEVRGGKTVIAIYLASLLNTPFLVIVPRISLISQWMKEIIKFTNIKNAEIGVIQQKTCNYKDKIACIASLQSLYKDKYPEDLKHVWGLVVFDEIHNMGSQKFSNVVKMFPARYRLGLTGTLRRSDKMEDVFLQHLGGRIISVSMSNYQPKIKVIVVHYPKSSGKIPFWAKTRIQQRASLISKLVDNNDRNSLIARLIISAYNKGRDVLVLSERIRQLHTIKYMISKVINDVDIGIIEGKIDNSTRKKILASKKIILASTQILKEGITIPRMRTLIFGTPLGDAEQAIGRIRNPNPELPEPVVFDIVDTKYDDAIRWFERRKKLYNRICKEWVSL